MPRKKALPAPQTDSSAPAKSSGGVDAVDRAVTILRCFSDRDPSLSLAELAARTGYYKSTILRLITSLERASFLVRLPDKSFALGSELMRLGAAYQHSFRLETHVRPALKSLLGETRESASFFIRDQDMRICLFREDSAHTIRDHVREGDRLILNQGAAGHVLLRFDPAQNSELGLQAQFKDLPLFSYGERDAETAAAAVPVYAARGGRTSLAGALTISGPRTRFTPQTTPQIGKLLLEAGRNLSFALGGGTMWNTLSGTKTP
ncbi:IclR family transcriptional regulator [Ferrovibrio xuzhouensis]|uniref:IclR family transcriptional regulator n=1 Tax=Ferrovibrio xuzhouensis TaxID=1576914 RepID=A0ABV7VBU4_9PROT